MIRNETETRPEALHEAARRMATAARTAPKGCGKDQLEILVVDGDDVTRLAGEMARLGAETGPGAFTRDAGNLRQAPVVFLLGTGTRQMGLKRCGLCGYPDCAANAAGPGGWCAFVTGDLGIALGSAVAVAADLRVDNRVMYTVGMAAVNLGFFTPDVKVAYGVPLSATGKNPFFDRPAPVVK